MNERLHRRNRIKKRDDIKSFFGNKKETSFLSSKKNVYSVIVKPNGLSYYRFAVSVKKNKGSAPVRNKEKRIVREILRKNKENIVLGYDYFIIVNIVQLFDFELKSKYLLSVLSRVAL